MLVYREGFSRHRVTRYQGNLEKQPWGHCDCKLRRRKFLPSRIKTKTTKQRYKQKDSGKERERQKEKGRNTKRTDWVYESKRERNTQTKRREFETEI